MFRSSGPPLFEGVNLRLEICGSGPEEKNLHNLSNHWPKIISHGCHPEP